MKLSKSGGCWHSSLPGYRDQVDGPLALPIVSPDIRREFGITEGDDSHVITLDRLGAKRGFAVCISSGRLALTVFC